MSAVVERFLVCDHYAKTAECEANFGTDDRSRGLTKLRRDAKSNGWFYRNGKDYCPACAAELGFKHREKKKI